MLNQTFGVLRRLGDDLLSRLIDLEMHCPHCGGTEFFPYQNDGNDALSDECLDLICARCGLDLPRAYYYPWDLVS